MRLFLFTIFFSSAFFLRAQTGTVTGFLRDTLHRPVASATITLQNAADSSLVAFTITGTDGRFSFRNLKDATYRITTAHLAFHGAAKRFTINTQIKNVVLDTIILFDKAMQLKEFEFVDEAPPVTMRGDTLEFNAGSFKTAPDAAVEELLKKLPGVEILQDGTIRVNGQTVSKILVDGKEFFGSDPNIASKNLPADAIDKVQVFDKKSDAEILTGMNDGSKDPTINLTLKADKKKGAFGTAVAGYGTDNRYRGKLNVNRFNNGQQLAILANANNINEQPFSFMDMLSFMGGLQSSGGNGMQITIRGDDNNGISSLLNPQRKGNNDNWSTGFSFGDDLGKKKNIQFTGSYFYNRLHPVLREHNARTYFLPDSTYSSSSDETSDGYTDNHRLNFQLRVKTDSLGGLFRWAPSFNMQNGRTTALESTNWYNAAGHATNSIERATMSGSDGINFANELLYQKPLAKRGRSFSTQLSSAYKTGKAAQLNYNNANLELNDSTVFSNAFSRRLTQLTNVHTELFRAGYTEPLGKKWLAELSGKAGRNDNSNARNTYDYNSTSDDYDLLFDSLSNSYRTNWNYAQAAAKVKFNAGKLTLTGGLAQQFSQLRGIDAGTEQFSRNFTHLLPSGQLVYSFTKYRELTLNYSSNVEAPALQLLQPVTDATNPFYISNGNTALAPEKSDAVNFDFHIINPFENRHFFFAGNLQRTSNRITTSDSITGNGITYSRPVNGGAGYEATVFSGIEFPLRKLKSTISIEPEVSYEQFPTYINGVLNTGTTLLYRPAVNWFINGGDNFNASLHARYTISDATYSFSSSTYRFTKQNYGISFTWRMPKSFTLESDFSYIFNASSTGISTDFPLWKASLNKQFGKSKRAGLKLNVYDILNRNNGITQNAGPGYIEDQTYTILKRYALLSFSWKLNKLGGEARRGGMEIRIGGNEE